MKQSDIHGCLVRIRDRYRALFQLTGLLEQDLSAVTIQRILAQRQDLLDEINGDQKLLDGWPQWRDTLPGETPLQAEVLSEIKMLIDGIVKLDAAVQKAMRRKIDEISGELKNLSSSSKAALSYASQGSYRPAPARTAFI